jgi:hypothetical protein
MLSQRIAASVGLDGRAQPLTREEGLPLLAAAEATRSVSTEMVALLGSGETVSALGELNRAVWRMEWFARGLLDDGSSRDGQRRGGPTSLRSAAFMSVPAVIWACRGSTGLGSRDCAASR